MNGKNLNQRTFRQEIAVQTSSEDLLEKNQDFYLTENSIAKREEVRNLASRIKYSPTRVKSKTMGFLVFGNILYCQHLLCFETLDTLEDPTFIHNFLLGKVQQGMSAHKGLVIAC